MGPRILIAIGTLAEAVKVMDLALWLARFGARPILCKTSQTDFELDYNLDLIHILDFGGKPYKKGLITASGVIVDQVCSTAAAYESQLVVCVGDTTTAWGAALAADKLSLPCVHIEAGMRTNSLSSPFPEEFYRRHIDITARLHVCFHKHDRFNLAREGLLVDELCLLTHSTLYDDMARHQSKWIVDDHTIVHIHRRETSEDAFLALLHVLNQYSREFDYSGIRVIMNRRFRDIAFNYQNFKMLTFLSPINRPRFLDLIGSSACVISDSGTVQEECFALGIPNLIFRNETERPYLLDEIGSASLIGHNALSHVPIIAESIELAASQKGSRRQLKNGLTGASERAASFIVERAHYLVQ